MRAELLSLVGNSPFQGAALVVALLTLSLGPATVLAQGSLTPPGAPAPTMKSLSQIEPRTPITGGGAVTISNSGSYYLATNISVTAGNAITINADNVTLDLNGFTVSSTEPSASGTGILLNGGRAHVHIFNGHILGYVTQSGGVYSGVGFGYGIYYTNGSPHNVRVSGVSVSGCLLDGMNLNNGNSTVVESCTVDTVGGAGIVAASVLQCAAYACGSYGIDGTTVDNCFAYSTGYIGLYGSVANNCHGSSDTSDGLDAVASAANCRGYSGGDGQGVTAYTAINCYGFSSSGIGVSASFANNCFGTSSTGWGLSSNGAATGCEGFSTSGSLGLTGYIVQNSYGEADAAGSFGLQCEIASCSVGWSSGGTGLKAIIANSCQGSSLSVSYKYNMP